MQALDDLNPSLGGRLRARATELDISPKDRLYCPNPRCSVFPGSWSSFKNRVPASGIAAARSNPRYSGFLGSLISFKNRFAVSARGSASSQFHQCPSCSERVCILCKERAHLGTLDCRTVEEELMEVEFRNLVRENSWQTCPGCSAVVELAQGCSHITCRCRKQETLFTCIPQLILDDQSIIDIPRFL
ncbi:hypothetical protein BDP27DRAFT_1319998, partial [Rhodocollybia butyracea]